MNRREALRSLAGGCAAGALAAAGMMVATPGAVTADERAEYMRRAQATADVWFQLTQEEKEAVIKEVEAEQRRRGSPPSPAWTRFRQNALWGSL